MWSFFVSDAWRWAALNGALTGYNLDSFLTGNGVLTGLDWVCTKSRRAKVRQGKNRRGTAGVAFNSTCCK
ncbi:hypothetical protein B1F73_02170 [Pseudomonas syringae]|nr:hypothetical protein B1F77_03305 [Pseudomonas syringae]RXT84121.1 hypothetical protein B1F72_16565 [Pseudomonas syringae]RXU02948.1 hypothetical protein B1F73_02170 [Pseudomonas syringae]RXU22236.1 hypothetical protein B0A92_19860 [Pseudomonas syringae]